MAKVISKQQLDTLRRRLTEQAISAIKIIEERDPFNKLVEPKITQKEKWEFLVSGKCALKFEEIRIKTWNGDSFHYVSNILEKVQLPDEKARLKKIEEYQALKSEYETRNKTRRDAAEKLVANTIDDLILAGIDAMEDVIAEFTRKLASTVSNTNK